MLQESIVFFEKPSRFDEKVIEKKYSEEGKSALKAFINNLDNSITKGEAIKNTYSETLNNLNINPGKYMQLLRVSLTGAGEGPDLGVILEILGPQEIKDRINFAIPLFNKVKN